VDSQIPVVAAEPLRNRAEAALRDAIVSGQLLPGTRLVEVQLAERLGVSRGTLRQALRELEHAGFVVSVPYRGTYVAEQTPNVLRDAYELRGVLEGFAATQVPADAIPGIVATQRRCVQQMHQALEGGRYADVAAIDLEFHTPLCDASGNQRLHQVWGTLSAPLQARYANDVESLYEPAEVISRHELLIDLLQAAAPGPLEAGIRDHYMETARRMTAAIGAPDGIARRETIGDDPRGGKA
jgi:DNA-binding GntR family transcriptional regulator